MSTPKNTDALRARIAELRARGIGRYETIAELGITEHQYRVLARGVPLAPRDPDRVAAAAPVKPASIPALVEQAKKSLRGGRQLTYAAIRSSLGIDEETTSEVVRRLEEGGAVWHGSFLVLEKPTFGAIRLDKLDAGHFRVGLVADTHLGCREARLDALHATYDKFAKEGIKHVLHAGNLVDGYVPRINGASVIVSSIDDQTLYVVDNYPKRPGITTHFLTGDDHEGWWQKEGFNWGFYMQSVAEREGRADLRYIGHVEADVRIGACLIKVQHPGGGSAYARSYTGQKQVESFQSGEKPHILVQGHYHVSNYMVERGIHVVGMPGFQDQTVFARKKRLRMEIGGALLDVRTDANGVPSDVGLRFYHFWDRGYYRDFLRSDARLKKGQLVLPN